VIAPTAIPGQLTRLAGTTAEGTLEGHVALYTNVKLTLTPAHQPRLTDIYAKVLALTPADTGRSSVRLELTSVPEAAKAFLARIGQAAPDRHAPQSPPAALG
jgi:hypothetical protein